MLKERVRLVYLSKDRTDIKQISLAGRKFCFFAILFAFMLVAVTVFMSGLFTRFYHNYRITSLKNDRKHLQKELLAIKERVALLSNRLAQVEVTGDELRNVASLPQIDNDIRQVGVGGPSYYGSFDSGYYSDEVNRTATEIRLDLNKLERVIRLEKSSS